MIRCLSKINKVHAYSLLKSVSKQCSERKTGGCNCEANSTEWLGLNKNTHLRYHLSNSDFTIVKEGSILLMGLRNWETSVGYISKN